MQVNSLKKLSRHKTDMCRTCGRQLFLQHLVFARIEKVPAGVEVQKKQTGVTRHLYCWLDAVIIKYTKSTRYATYTYIIIPHRQLA